MEKPCFSLDLDSDTVKDLLDLVAKRNKIVHIKSELHVFRKPFDENELKKPVIKQEKIDLLKNIPIEKLLSYQNAIKILEEEFVENIFTGKYQQGKILKLCQYTPGQ